MHTVSTFSASIMVFEITKQIVFMLCHLILENRCSYWFWSSFVLEFRPLFLCCLYSTASKVSIRVIPLQFNKFWKNQLRAQYHQILYNIVCEKCTSFRVSLCILSVLWITFESALISLLAEYPQCYCGEIRQMFTFITNLYCWKLFIGNYSIRIVEYHRKKSLNPTSSPGLELRSFRVCDLSFCNILFETNNFGLAAVLLSYLVSELQETPSPGLELRTLFRSFYPTMFSFWSQGISIPSLVQIGLSFLELEVNIHTYIQTYPQFQFNKITVPCIERAAM
jgi:hypothetical protein